MSATNSKQEFENVPENEIPAWLNEQFFTDILRKEHDNNTSDDFKVKIVSIKPAVGAGENYVAMMYRVAVQAQHKTHSFILKCFLGQVENVVDYPMFPNEMHMYSKIIPALENEFNKIGEKVQFGPKCFLVTNEPIPIIVLQDLRPDGYSVQNRFNGIDKKHCKILLTKLAKFHAASVIYFDKHEELKYKTKPTFSREYKKVMIDFINGRMKYFEKAIKENELLKPLANKIANWELESYNEMARIAVPDQNSFNVMTHGDVWVNNYLFSHYDATKLPNDILFVDYQISHWGSPTLDLLYFYVSSTENELDDSDFNDFIQFYHAELVNSLQKLGFEKEVLSLKQLHIDLLKNGYWAAFNCFMVAPIVLLEPREDANVETMFNDTEGGDDLKRATYENPRLIRRLEKLLPFLDKKGLLEI